MNQVILCGNVGHDPQLKESGETQMVNLSVATNSRIKKDGEWADKTTWHSVIFWGKQAEFIAKYAKKGDSITLSGELNYRQYTDKSGVEKKVTEIKANSYTLVKRDRTSAPSTSAAANDLPF